MSIKAPIKVSEINMWSCSAVRAPALSLKTSFLGNGPGALKVKRLRLSSNQLRCNAYRGGALGTRMNFFMRFARVMKSFAVRVLTFNKDHEKILEQTLLKMNEDLKEMRKATDQVLAFQKQLKNIHEAAELASVDWNNRALLAVGKGEDDLAREALDRHKDYADNANALKAQLDQQKSIVDSLVSKTRLLESKIEEAKLKKVTLLLRAQSATTAARVRSTLANVNTSSALSVFEKMEEEVVVMESLAEELNQLTFEELEGKFALLEGMSTEVELENLKEESFDSTKKGELPPGRTTVTSPNSAFPFREAEIEREPNELKRNDNEF